MNSSSFPLIPVTCAAFLAFALHGPAQESASEPLVVHEWGVEVTGGSRAVIKEAKSPWLGDFDQITLGPASERLDDLPSFVQRPESILTDVRPTGGWDKPIIHVYGGEPGQKLKITIGTPLGVPLAYYPKPALHRTPTLMTMFSRFMHADSLRLSRMNWDLRLRKDAPVLPPAPDGHWWNDLRKVPGRYLETETGNERFLFYEATAQISRPLTIWVDDNELMIRSQLPQSVKGPLLQRDYTTRLLVMINDDGAYRMGAKAINLTNKGVVNTLNIKTNFRSIDGRGSQTPEQSISEIFRQRWRNQGLTSEETFAILQAWKEDLLNTRGILCMYVIPREMYEAMFPIKIDPKPDELVRVGMVFDRIPNAHRRLNLLPRTKKRLEGIVNAVQNGTPEEQVQALVDFETMGDLAFSYYRTLGRAIPQLRPVYEKMQSAHYVDIDREDITFGPGPEWFQPDYRPGTD